MAPMAASIPEYFAGRCVFITGATGFMGKVLVEKLLRSCPEVKTLYLLIRSKKGRDVFERLEAEILTCQLFDQLRALDPDFGRKLVPVPGDVLHDGLGLDGETAETLLENVSVVFHAAATLKFDEAMKMAADMNVAGVKRVLTFCKRMKKLEAFVHVSTAFSHCDRRDCILEQLYPPPIHHDQLFSALEWMNDETLDFLTPKMLGLRPNTYTYTKAVAENLVFEEAGSAPITIVRPSVVVAAYREPVKGWVENLNGTTGVMAATGKGLMRVMNGDVNAGANIIPVDVAINMTIAAAWHTACRRQEGIAVYHCTPDKANNMTWGQMVAYSIQFWRKNPAQNIVRLPNLKMTTSGFWHDLIVLAVQLFPALLMDCYSWLRGRRRTSVRRLLSLQKAVSKLEFFTCRSWNFSNTNTELLLKDMTAVDREVFPFDTTIIDWAAYMESYCLGIKEFILKEPVSTLPQDRKALKRLQTFYFILYMGVLLLLAAALLRWIF